MNTIMELYLNYLNEIDNAAPVVDTLQLGRRIGRRIMKNPAQPLNPIPDPPAATYEVVEDEDPDRSKEIIHKIHRAKEIRSKFFPKTRLKKVLKHIKP